MSRDKPAHHGLECADPMCAEEVESMNVWGSPDRLLAIARAADRKAAQSEELINEIVNALAVSGEYLTQLSLESTQRVVDLKWAARQAGRRLGMGVEIHEEISRATDSTLVRVVGQRDES
jgi:hypothetical protein